MRLLKCPKQEVLLEYSSISQEMNPARKLGIRLHAWTCSGCQKTLNTIRVKLEALFTPEPDITSSLIRVYSRLQKDETLILKGWKLGEFRSRPETIGTWIAKGWLFRGAVTLALGSLFVFLLAGQLKSDKQAATLQANQRGPYAQIRIEDKNRIKVQYVKPELLQSIEFETTNTR